MLESRLTSEQRRQVCESPVQFIASMGSVVEATAAPIDNCQSQLVSAHHAATTTVGRWRCVFKAKFRYAIWSQTGSKLVAYLLARASSS